MRKMITLGFFFRNDFCLFLEKKALLFTYMNQGKIILIEKSCRYNYLSKKELKIKYLTIL